MPSPPPQSKLDIEAEAGDILAEIIDEVIKSTKTQPSIPGVVFDTINDVIQEPATVEPEVPSVPVAQAAPSNTMEEETQELAMDIPDDDQAPSNGFAGLLRNKSPERQQSDPAKSPMNGHVIKDSVNKPDTSLDTKVPVKAGHYQKVDKKLGPSERELNRGDSQDGTSTISRQVSSSLHSLFRNLYDTIIANAYRIYSHISRPLNIAVKTVVFACTRI